jgi:hypothetical protein
MRTCLVFQTKTIADAVSKEIAATPFGAVWTWYDPDGDVNMVQYLVAGDGRCAMLHDFEDLDREWLDIYLEGYQGVTVLNALPSDWSYPVNV